MKTWPYQDTTPILTWHILPVHYMLNRTVCEPTWYYCTGIALLRPACMWLTFASFDWGFHMHSSGSQQSQGCGGLSENPVHLLYGQEAHSFSGTKIAKIGMVPMHKPYWGSTGSYPATTAPQRLRTIRPTSLVASARNVYNLLHITWKTGFCTR
jgi:hypothetical protein